MGLYDCDFCSSYMETDIAFLNCWRNNSSSMFMFYIIFLGYIGNIPIGKILKNILMDYTVLYANRY